MFLPHYGFKESPFGVTPDPRFLYASETHREALASLLYGMDSGLGFMTLTALPGMGKTTLLFDVLTRLRQRATTAFIFQPVSAPVDLLRLILSEVGIPSPPGGLVELQMRLNELLIQNAKEGKRFILVIDEAQNMNEAVLEQVRMLSNFETSREKLMQIILAGQPQLAARLASPELLQLRQRISIAAHLEPFSPQETAAYIAHRLTIAGYDRQIPIFSPSAVEMIARYSEGIPRNINNICFNALALACALKRTTIGIDVIGEVMADLDLARTTNAGNVKPAAPIEDTEPPRKLPLSILDADLDEPKRSAWPQLAITLLAVTAVVIAFGFVYVKFLRPYRGNFPFGTPAKVASPAVPASTTSTPEAPEATSNSEPAANAVPPPTSETVAAPDPAPVPESSESSVARAPVVPVRSIRVHRGQSLFNICLQVFRNCNPEVFRTLLDANPGLSNPNHIVPGQQIFVPTSPHTSSGEPKR